jgi:hypothetical protein
VDLASFIVATHCLVDDLIEELLDDQSLRSRGPAPLLDDREVLTIEICREFLGIDTDKGLYEFFVRHFAEWYPRLGVASTAPPSPGRWPSYGR